MTAANVLNDLGSMLLSGNIEVVDCTGTLGPDTPILQLPEDFAKNTPKIEIHKISEYDSDGPFFAWNWMVLGEHSGTHFDAPHHWITGKDYEDGYTDSLDIQRVVAPVNVIDCSKESAADADFLLTPEHVKAWEAEHGEIGAGEWVVMRTDWDKRAHDEALFLNADENGRTAPDRRRNVWNTCCRKRSWAGAASASAPMPGVQAVWNLPFRRTTSCTVTIALVSRRWPIWTSCPPRGLF